MYISSSSLQEQEDATTLLPFSSSSLEGICTESGLSIECFIPIVFAFLFFSLLSSLRLVLEANVLSHVVSGRLLPCPIIELTFSLLWAVLCDVHSLSVLTVCVCVLTGMGGPTVLRLRQQTNKIIDHK